MPKYTVSIDLALDWDDDQTPEEAARYLLDEIRYGGWEPRVRVLNEDTGESFPFDFEGS